MRIFIQVLIIGIASNLDNLAVGVAYGIHRIAVPTLPNLAIAAFAFVFSVVGIVVSSHLSHYFPQNWDNALGAIIIIGIGIYLLPIWKRKRAKPAPSSNTRPSVMDILREPELANLDHSHKISLYESLLLGVALSLNCLTNGIPAGLWNLNAWSVATCNAVMSFVTLWFGAWFGKRYGALWLGRRADAISGILLILIGLHEAFGG